MNNPAAIFFGGRDVGQDKFDWARETGITVILIDCNVNCSASEKVDFHVAVSREDTTRIIEKCRLIANNHGLHLVGLYCGIDLDTVPALVAQGLGIPYASVGVLACCADKAKMKECFASRQVPTPRLLTDLHLSGSSGDSIDTDSGFVVKPTISSGSRGVTRVDDISSLEAAIQLAKEHTTTGEVIIEEFLDGTHHDLNGLFWNDVFYPAGIMSRLFFQDENCMSAAASAPSQIEPEIIRDGYLLLEKAARSVGISIGPVKGDLILTQQGWFVLEVAPRFHGDIQTVQLVPHGPGINAFKALFDSWINKDPQSHLVSQAGVSGWKLILPNKDGVFCSIIGISDALEITGVINIFTLKNPGDRVRALADNNLDMVSIVIAAADDYTRVQDILNEASNKLVVCVE